MLRYWLWLATRKGLSRRNMWLVARHFASAEAAYTADREAYGEIEGLKDCQSLLDKDLTQADQILRQCYEKGISILTVQDAAYPDRLRVADDPPVVLYYKGMLPNLNGPIVGVVGTRKASAYGMTQARRMGYNLARCGCVVVSGGAKGIDTEALKGALTGGGSVVVVLGCGADVVYPAENRSLFRDVEANGCLISEYPPGMPPLSANFPVRNRIISGLSLGILVVEAPKKSCALITANRALEQGRDVFVLPANVDVDSCSGNLALLREGAIPVRDAWDLLEEYEALYPGILSKQLLEEPVSVQIPPETVPVETPRIQPKSKKDIDKPKPRAYIDLKDVMDGLNSEERLLAELLQEGPVHVDVIADRSGLNAARAVAVLTLLEVKGIVRHPSANVYELMQTEN